MIILSLNIIIFYLQWISDYNGADQSADVQLNKAVWKVDSSLLQIDVIHEIIYNKILYFYIFWSVLNYYLKLIISQINSLIVIIENIYFINLIEINCYKYSYLSL